jgi:flagellar assembly factor FliW
MGVPINAKGGGIIEVADLSNHLRQHHLNLEDVTVYLVTSIRNENGQQRVSVNTKAPILLAPSQREGWQVILENPNYEVTHYLV